ncbi:ADP-ribosylglycohydrolase family protein [Xanthomonas sp. LF07-6]|uniref:ADP-ribosylglycohydrolase family protein n=1 Tax=Xanthomonas sp. LF07-6 TaxID=3097550 RepID=UPI002A8199C4|nr:ADP-ribosylglycohydrolase family protein [Xanthomonas sp. LF07-6]MDY4339778.1 ADP-ribosylglycohydrolase family protein [Xanthomonas sp. LF07-6]
MIHTEKTSPRERMVINSALWAAAGDALGWITELAHGSANVMRRSGTATVQRPVAWERVIGGRTGPKVALPAGTYSDDTQLRLAVSRCIRNGGTFDAEAFAKIELTVWPSYALGAGRGTKAAAANLARRNTTWYSNFFESGSQRYVSSGGNGAAMRVQPHVWARKSSGPELVLTVLQDALITHGHPQGFCGAVFHALTLHATISAGAVAGPDVWTDLVETFLDIPEILDNDPQLAAFWRAAWESKTGNSLPDALQAMRDASLKDIESIHSLAKSMEPEEYPRVLDALGCTSQEFRGAGFKTALAASVLAHMHRSSSPAQALVQSANELESDTDTIATMAGAILGACVEEAPNWPIQDHDYIVREAARLARIAAGQPSEYFIYPDLARWSPPANQHAAVGQLGDNVALAGLGMIRAEGQDYRSGDSIWQWYRLPFGQTILAKRKATLPKVAQDQMPGESARLKATQSPKSRNQPGDQGALSFEDGRNNMDERSKQANSYIEHGVWSIDRATDEAIRSNFDPAIVGTLFNRCLDETESIEQVIAFAAILGKARLARRRKRDR